MMILLFSSHICETINLDHTFLGAVLEAELRALHLLGRCSTT
jgi:hypothetical protein